MKMKMAASVSSAILLLTGCASVSQQRAIVADGMIQNRSLGFFGFTFKIPDGFEVYSPAAKNPAEYSELQHMAIRIYNLNKIWHPRDNELFYESFLLMSGKTCFLLITVKSGHTVQAGDSPFSGQNTASWQLMPLYNITARRPFEMGEPRQPAEYTCGYAYEQKGWYYAAPKRNSMPFSYEACKIEGGNRDSYILMGFSSPGHEAELTAAMKQMTAGFQL